MRTDLQLYIGTSPADINEDSYILMNYSNEEATNPTIVKCSYSQSVTLPGTPRNHAIFGSFFRLDRATVAGGGIGAQYNPLKRVPFTIYTSLGEVAARGYCKLESVAYKGAEVYSYSVSLYGGLSGFFYNYSYKADGTKKTLGDLYWPDLQAGQGYTIEPNDQRPFRAQDVASAWSALAAGTEASLGQVLNFAPCYNGIPDDTNFDASKAIYKGDKHPNIYLSKTVDGTTYTPKSDANGYVMMEMAGKHTEWEIGDLRANRQRPVVRVMYLLYAMQMTENAGDYRLMLDSQFFASNNPYYTQTWITMPIPAHKSSATSYAWRDYLDGSDTPAAYLISYAKTFGLMFVVDEAAKTITLMSRDKYYTEYKDSVIDLTGKVDFPSIGVKPYGVDTKTYLFQNEMQGQYASEYEDKYSRRYGSYALNTGYDFDNASSDLMKDTALQGAADVVEGSAAFVDYAGGADPTTGSITKYDFKMPFLEDVKWKLWNGTKTLDCAIEDKTGAPYFWGNDHYIDFLPKIQLHEAEGKPTDGAGVLLFFCGVKDVPETRVGSVGISQAQFFLTDDNAAMTTLAGKPCYDVSDTGTQITSLPSFRRALMDGSTMKGTLDWGDPRETATPSETYVTGKNIFAQRWQGYLADRYDVDSKVMECKVDLRSYNVGNGLLRHFFYFGGAVWSLNKIINHSLTTDGLTDCEFVKVKSINAYANSQYLLSEWYLYTDVSSVSFAGAGGSATINVNSNDTWTASSNQSWASVSRNGNVITVTVPATQANRAATITITGAHSTGATVSVAQAVSQYSYQFSNVQRTYSAGASAILADGSNYAMFKATVKVYDGATLVETRENEPLIPSLSSEVFYVNGNQIKAYNLGTEQTYERSVTPSLSYAGVSVPNTTYVSQQANTIVSTTPASTTTTGATFTLSSNTVTEEGGTVYLTTERAWSRTAEIYTYTSGATSGGAVTTGTEAVTPTYSISPNTGITATTLADHRVQLVIAAAQTTRSWQISCAYDTYSSVKGITQLANTTYAIIASTLIYSNGLGYIAADGSGYAYYRATVGKYIGSTLVRTYENQIVAMEPEDSTHFYVESYQIKGYDLATTETAQRSSRVLLTWHDTLSAASASAYAETNVAQQANVKSVYQAAYDEINNVAFTKSTTTIPSSGGTCEIQAAKSITHHDAVYIYTSGDTEGGATSSTIVMAAPSVTCVPNTGITINSANNKTILTAQSTSTLRRWQVVISEAGYGDTFVLYQAGQYVTLSIENVDADDVNMDVEDCTTEQHSGWLGSGESTQMEFATSAGAESAIGLDYAMPSGYGKLLYILNNDEEDFSEPENLIYSKYCRGMLIEEVLFEIPNSELTTGDGIYLIEKDVTEWDKPYVLTDNEWQAPSSASATYVQIVGYDNIEIDSCFCDVDWATFQITDDNSIDIQVTANTTGVYRKAHIYIMDIGGDYIFKYTIIQSA